jgi:hypothetical protein
MKLEHYWTEQKQFEVVKLVFPHRALCLIVTPTSQNTDVTLRLQKLLETLQF